MSKPATMWAVFSRDGSLVRYTISETRINAIYAYVCDLRVHSRKIAIEKWIKEKRRQGVYCAKVRVEEIK